MKVHGLILSTIRPVRAADDAIRQPAIQRVWNHANNLRDHLHRLRFGRIFVLGNVG